MTTTTTRPGLDGLDVELLRSSRASWWDAAFTRRLLDAIPDDAGALVDIGCGLGHAARALLPHRPGCRYIGVDADGERVTLAAAASADLDAEWQVGLAEALPLADASVDVALTVMTLQHLLDVPAALREAARVLRPGGRLVAAEPDNLGQRFYADGELEELTVAVRELSARAREARRPADLAIGPRVAALVGAAGFEQVTVVVHAVHTTRTDTRAHFLDRIATVVRAIAGGQVDLTACEQAIAGARARLGDGLVMTSQVVPVFVCCGIRPAHWR